MEQILLRSTSEPLIPPDDRSPCRFTVDICFLEAIQSADGSFVWHVVASVSSREHIVSLSAGVPGGFLVPPARSANLLFPQDAREFEFRIPRLPSAPPGQFLFRALTSTGETLGTQVDVRWRATEQKTPKKRLNYMNALRAIRAQQSLHAVACGMGYTTPETLLEFLRTRRSETEAKLLHRSRERKPPRKTFEFYEPPHFDASLPARNICIVTYDFPGPIRNGGIGSYYLALAHLLVQAGHRVTVLYSLGGLTEEAPVALWRKEYSRRGIEFVVLEPASQEIRSVPMMTGSEAVYRWLQHKQFDWIHFPEMLGIGLCSLMAKRAGLAFENTTLCVELHSPTVWHLRHNRQLSWQDFPAAVDFAEQRSVELADVVVSPTRYLLQWVHDRGWRVPANAFIVPSPVPLELQATTPRLAPASTDIRELVFFGRLESRKGLELFCDAVEVLQNVASVPLTVTFLGKPGMVQGASALDYLAKRKRRWRWPANIITSFNRDAAIDYLSSGGRLAVLPSLADNAPYAVLECLHARIPFVCLATGGTLELIAEEDRLHILAEPTAAGLVKVLQDAIREPRAPARPSFSFEEVNRLWDSLHHDQFLRPIPQPHRTCECSPLVSICIAHRNRPELLMRALRAVAGQAYRPTEVILVDDGSDRVEAIRLLDTLEESCGPLDLKIVRETQRGVAAARNIAAAHAKGEYLLFVDDDNLIRPDALQTLVSVANRTGADIVPSSFDIFLRGDEDQYPGRAVFPGGGFAANLRFNALGDTFALIKRELFYLLGGFNDSLKLCEDWELFSRALLLGSRIETAPEALLSYEQHLSARSYEQGMYTTYRSPINVYSHILPPFAVDLSWLRAGLEPAAWRHIVPVPSRQEKLALKQTFLSAPRSLLLIDKSTSFHGIGRLHHMRIVGRGEGLRLTSSANDPHFELLPVPLEPGRRIYIRVRMISTCNAWFMIFYHTYRHNYVCENQRLLTRIESGLNDLFFELAAPGLNGIFRIHPADHFGEFDLRSLEFKSD